MQLASGPYDFAHVSPLLKKAADTIDETRSDGHLEEGAPTVSKIDITRDLGGCFFAIGDSKKLYKELQHALSETFDTSFKDSGNSFDSNFQFVD